MVSIRQSFTYALMKSVLVMTNQEKAFGVIVNSSPKISVSCNIFFQKSASMLGIIQKGFLSLKGQLMDDIIEINKMISGVESGQKLLFV